MKLEKRLERLEKYCYEVSRWYPIKCEVKVEPSESEQDSEWAFIVVYDISGAGHPTTTSYPSPAVGRLEAWLDDLMVNWFSKNGGKGRLKP